jgi:tetratricopeptide (TPR) repeat protein
MPFAPRRDVSITTVPVTKPSRSLPRAVRAAAAALRAGLLVAAALGTCASLGAGRASAQQAALTSTPPQAVANMEGLAHLRARDYDGALMAFRRAIQSAGGDPAAYYYLGSTHRLRGQPSEALEMFRTARQLAQASGNARMEAMALAAVASTLELLPNKLDEARAAWQEYVRFADANSGLASPRVGRSRIQAIDAAKEIREAYAPVRERIAERERLQQRPGGGGRR